MSKGTSHGAMPFFTRSREQGRAECTCGWAGPWRHKYHDARLDADQHNGAAFLADETDDAGVSR